MGVRKFTKYVRKLKEAKRDLDSKLQEERSFTMRCGEAILKGFQ